MTFLIILKYVSLAFRIYSFLLIIYILMSWVPAAQNSSFGRMLAKVCEPYLGIFRRFIPPIGMIDISPIVAIFMLNFIERGLYIVIQKIYFMFL
ncbi:YggT family protein [Lysinibacillus sp. FSL H8-0500]|uniref:Membrane protein n=1 Tax=Lysinibacillus macroides TaxID=33935 RepID=A0A0N0CW54_9BACI|nr:YggT family protein [Lysinibacillus macroides]KOY82597.1 membrane protein [Lysinibacillus macroides]QPR66360.1 YggT family protein [Lysinibacillus macroides]